jgi:hypothetical protein
VTGRYLLAVLLAVALLAGAYALMWRGWRRRGRAQADLPPLPAPPPASRAPGADPSGAVEGTYVGTTTAGDWLDRVVVHSLGRRSPALVRVDAGGVLVERDPEPALYVPAGAVRAVRLDRAIAGKVVEEGGLVVVTWEHGGRRLDTGVRPRSAADAVALRDAVRRLLEEGEAA